jgi:hypothetical protein
MLWPVYEFRPLPKIAANGDILRYNAGKWTPDDGEYDLAFIYNNICLMVELPYQKNIIWSWYDTHWGATEPRHPRRNAWHYALREGATDWGGDWRSYAHPNRRAGDSGMNKAADLHGYANGRHIEFKPPSQHIMAGLVRERETGKLLTIPTDIHCCFCGDEYRHESHLKNAA